MVPWCAESMTSAENKEKSAFTPGKFSFKGSSILSTKQFAREDLDYLFAIANEMRHIVETRGGTDLAKGRVTVNLFYEPSTRTSSSFQAAMYRLGGQVRDACVLRALTTHNAACAGRLFRSPMCRTRPSPRARRLPTPFAALSATAMQLSCGTRRCDSYL